MEQRKLGKFAAAAAEGDLYYYLCFKARPEGILLTNSSNAILDLNPAACTILKRTREEMLEDELGTVFDSSDPNVEPAWEEQLRTGRYTGVLRLLRRGKVPFSAEVSMTSYQGNASAKVVEVAFRDINDHKRIEETLVHQSYGVQRVLMEELLSGRGPNTSISHCDQYNERSVGRCQPKPALGAQVLKRPAADNGTSRLWSSKTKVTPEPLLESLTPREIEVLYLLGRGQSNQQIAETLTITLGTAKLHVHHVIVKLGVSDRTQAAIHAIRSGVCEVD